MIKCVCKFCNKEFFSYPIHHRMFCSPKCYWQSMKRKFRPHRRTGKFIKCLICNKEFYIPRNRQYKAKYCSCKCKKIGMIGRENPHKGHKMSKENMKKILLAISGSNNWNWKGGISQHTFGYKRILNPHHPYCDGQGYVFEHRLVMEKHIGRYLKPKERIHHINGIKDDNRLENLMLFPNHSEHIKFHHPLGSKFGIHSPV